MRNLRIWILFCSSIAGSVACQGDSDDASAGDSKSGSGFKRTRQLIEQVPPPVDLKAPPADATKTASGLSYKKLVAKNDGEQPTRSDKVLIQYTGWRQRTGDTFFTTRGRGQPIALDIAHAAPGFREALPLMHKGEKAVLWIPPGEGVTEPLVYELELLDILAPPTPPAAASRPSGDASPPPPAR